MSVIVVCMLVLVKTAHAENYGGVSRTQQAKITRLIYAKFGSGWFGRTMVCIAKRESGLNPRAANWGDSNGGSHGLFQINGIHRSWVDLNRIYDPIYNINVAYRLSRNGTSLTPWGGGC